MLAATALAACSGGGGGGGSSNDRPSSGIADNIAGASAVFNGALTAQQAILNSSVVAAGRTEVPATGTATYSGVGRIYDSRVTDALDTATLLRGRAVVTDVSGNVDFGAKTIAITQSNFRDVDGAAVAGSATWTAQRYESAGLFYSRVTGNVGGTTFDTGSEQARVGFFGDGSSSAIVGAFADAPVGTSGALSGSSVSGDFAATSN
jgi:hypothetical protein